MDLKRLRHVAQRIARMDQAELRDRLRQEYASRQDAVLAGFGYDFGGIVRQSVSASPKFFFSQHSIDSILGLMRERLPGTADGIIKRADQVCRHHFDLLGYEALDFGEPIDWHLDPVHGKRAPRKAFYKVRYLDFSEVGDSKITWELNRHQHFVILAKACRLTGNRDYADEVLRQYRHWWKENPYPVGINWASSLEAAFRSLSWLWTLHLLQGAPGVPDLRNEWLRGLAIHGRHMERHLSTYFSPNTHLLGEGVALCFLGVLCPELASAERWKSIGWKIVLAEAERQVRPDGFHFEQSAYYHVYALDFFLHFFILARVNGLRIPKSFEGTVERMLSALDRLAAGGSVPRFGDDDGGRLFDPERNCSEQLLDPVAAGAILFRRGDYKKSAGSLREETLWLLGEEGVLQWDALEESQSQRELGSLSDAGFYLLPAGDQTQLVVDAGPLGTQNGGHGHADALSVCLASAGRALLIDPGTYEYVGPGPERNLFRGTGMHNTVRIDGMDQAQPATAFSWQRLTATKVERWVQGKSFDLLVANHDGYQRLADPALHRRFVVNLRNGLFLIRDVVEGRGRHRLEVAWHLNQDLRVREQSDSRVVAIDDHLGLAILSVDGHGWAQQVRKECWSPAYGRKSPMTAVCFSTEVDLPAEFSSLLVTWREAQRNPGLFTSNSGANDEVRSYKYRNEDTEYLWWFGTGGQSWRTDLLTSDAEFVGRQRSLESTDEHLMLSGGSFAQLNGGAQVRCNRPVQWAEWIHSGGTGAAFSSDPRAIDGDFDVQRQDSSSPVVK